jgi:hypothetical protein
MTKLLLLTPTNLLTEKAKFFASSSYEPQFEYAEKIDSDTLNFYGQPQQKFFDHAVKIIQEFPRSGISSDRATLSQINFAVKTACEAANLPNLKVDFSPKHLSQARLDKATLFIRTPIKFSVNQLAGKIHHEIETHYLRILNNTALGLEPAIESYDFRSTEEGLANLHSYLDEADIPMRKTCLTYMGCYLTQEFGFRAAYDALISFKVAPDLAWSIITRSKRGLTDTSLPGGFTKDRTYLEGAVTVWQWLLNPKNQVRDLYAARISLKEVDQTKKLVEKTQAQLHFPKFIQNYTQYLATIQQIGLTNQFEKLIT